MKFQIQGGLAEGVKNFNPGTAGGILSGTDFGPIWSIVKVFLWFSVVVGVAVVYYKYWMQYKINITLMKRDGGSIEIKQDRAMVQVDAQGKNKLILLKNRHGGKAISCPVPEGEYKSKVGRKDHYILWLDDNGQLHPISHPSVQGYDEAGNLLVVEPEDTPQLRVRPQERDAWARYESKRLEEKYKEKDKFAQLIPAGLVFMGMIVVFLIWFFAVKELGSGLTNIGTQMAQIASACTVN